MRILHNKHFDRGRWAAGILVITLYYSYGSKTANKNSRIIYFIITRYYHLLVVFVVVFVGLFDFKQKLNIELTIKRRIVIGFNLLYHLRISCSLYSKFWLYNIVRTILCMVYTYKYFMINSTFITFIDFGCIEWAIIWYYNKFHYTLYGRSVNHKNIIFYNLVECIVDNIICILWKGGVINVCAMASHYFSNTPIKVFKEEFWKPLD